MQLPRFARRLAWPLAGFLVFGAVWEVSGQIVARHSGELMFAPLSSTLRALWELLWAERMHVHFWESGKTLVIGFGMAAIAGVAIGATCAVSSIARRALTPVLTIGYVTPLVALIPLFILLFGLSVGAKVAITFILAIFPIVINTESGLREVDPDYADTARSFCASPMQVLLKVIFPAAIVPVVTGLRLGLGRAIIGVVIAEIFLANAGFGYLIVYNSMTFNTATVLALVLLLSFFGVSLNMVLQAVENRMAPWRRGQR